MDLFVIKHTTSDIARAILERRTDARRAAVLRRRRVARAVAQLVTGAAVRVESDTRAPVGPVGPAAVHWRVVQKDHMRGVGCYSI